MKKFLILILVITLVFSLAAPVVAYAEKKDNPSEQSADKDNPGKRDKAHDKNQERKELREQLKADFEARKQERAELREMRKEQLAEQRQLTQAYKIQLQTMLKEMEGLSEEERAALADEAAELQLQIKEAHRYSLEIKAAFKADTQAIAPGVRAHGFPAEEEVEEIVEEVLEEL